METTVDFNNYTGFPWYTLIGLKNGYEEFLTNNPTKYIHLTYRQLEQLHKMFFMYPIPEILIFYSNNHGEYFKQLKWPPQVFDIVGVTRTLLPPERYIEFESYFKPSPFNFVVYRYIQIQPKEIICARGYTSTSLVPLEDFKSDYLMIIRIKKGDRILFLPTNEFEIVLPECCLIQHSKHDEGVYTFEITPYKVDKKMDAILATEMMGINFSKRKRRREYYINDIKELIFKNDLESVKKFPELRNEDYQELLEYTLKSSEMFFYILDKSGKLTEKQYTELLKVAISDNYDYDVDISKFLITKIDLTEGFHNHKIYDDYSPLQLAIDENNLEMVKLLLPSSNNFLSALEFAKNQNEYHHYHYDKEMNKKIQEEIRKYMNYG